MPKAAYQMFALFEMTPDLVCIVSKEGYFQQINPAVSNKLGYSEEELLASPVSTFIHPDDKERTAQVRSKLLEDQPLLNFQNRYVAKTGESVWLEWTSIYLPDQEIVFAIAKDITAGKKAELALEDNYRKYKNLTTHFKRNIEKDRHFLAAELHEDLAQTAASIKLNLDWIKTCEPHLSDVSKKRIEQVIDTSTILITKIRKLVYSIGEDRIGKFGLQSVLQSLCGEFTALSGIQCRSQINFDESCLSHETKLDIYRICQEALSNSLQHAQASLVTIAVQQVDDQIELTIADNGIGFDPSQEKHTFGFLTMKGRALTINGSLFIESKINNGTKVTLLVPAYSSKIPVS
ncbi:MAG TPA: PAS domain S-box protein [Flavisolibacter sp.]|nr:PAS domain S-box protein [Flavisolibacter sp.]